MKRHAQRRPSSRPATRTPFGPTVMGPVVIGLAALALAGCSTAAPTGSPTEFATVTGSAVPVADEVAALCEQIVAQQLPVEAATALAESSGYVSRIVTLDGEPQAATKDIQEDRMSFEVEGGVVTTCVGG